MVKSPGNEVEEEESFQDQRDLIEIREERTLLERDINFDFPLSQKRDFSQRKKIRKFASLSDTHNPKQELWSLILLLLFHTSSRKLESSSPFSNRICLSKDEKKGEERFVMKMSFHFSS